MNILSSLFTDDLAIDLGTVNTLIFAPDRGVVLNEPSAVAIHKYTGEVLEVGREAHKMLGREPKDVDVFRPVRGGTIENFDAVEKMLKAFIARVNGGSHRRSHVVIGVPGSSTSLEQRSVRDAARDAKATRVDLVDEGLCAALGAGGAIVASHSRQAAGNSMDQAICDYVRAKYEMQLGERSAENLKKEIGGTGEGREGKMEIVGKQVTDGLAKVVEIRAEEVGEAIEPVVAEIVEGARKLIEESKPDVTADIYQTGLILTGGGALLGGTAERLQKDLRLHVAVADDPLGAVALGAGRLLTDKARLTRAAIREDVPVWQSEQNLVVNW